ncbi:MAG: acyltransferase domain-containing protein [Desertifilum sp. SIO1I2]|nr:acyltransferase domain-containing protein [Desertifilum sp. SIO1I2]
MNVSHLSSSSSPSDIAIVGMSALFAKAANLQAYWHNILHQVDGVTEAPDSWAYPYFDPNSTENNRIYTRKGGFLGDLAQFNPLEFGIMPTAVDGGEPDQFLALKLARDALQDAGYDQKPFNRQKTGIILGRGTYVNRGYTTLLQHGMIVDQTLELLQQLCPHLDKQTLSSVRQGLKESLPPFSPEMLPGLVPNNVTGRIANRLDLMGPNFIIDAACASSLIAVKLAMQELLTHRCDMVLAGGIHASTPPQIYMIFCQLGGLSHSEIRPFDASANGTLLGEGLGILVLKRLADAQRDRDRIYAVLKGVGSASDGKALGLLAPRLEGEVLALERAYQTSGVDPGSIDLIEAHGTSIPLGDRTEIQALSQLFGPRQGQMPPIALGSVKSSIGHCIPAAGVAGLIKTALALYHKVLPPTLCEQVNPALGLEQTPFYINTRARPWVHGNPHLPRRAGVNAFGFGGINAHAVLEEYREPSPTASSLALRPPNELLIFSGDERAEFIELLKTTLSHLQTSPPPTLTPLGYQLSQTPIGSHRLAIIASDPADLAAKLALALDKLDSQPQRFQTRNGIYYGQGKPPGKVAFLFPGEGAQYTNMLADLCLAFPQVREWFDFLDQTFWQERPYRPSQVIFPPPTSLTTAEELFADRQLFAMDIGSETVFTASMALYELLEQCQIPCEAMVGHSTGENTALFASGTAQIESRAQLGELMRYLNQLYQELETGDRIPKGALLAVGAIPPDQMAQTLAAAEGRLHWAMDNCDNQLVLFGSETEIEAITPPLKAQGGICLRLPFDRAYHTPLFAGVAEAFRAFYEALNIRPSKIPLYSCATAEIFPCEPAAIRALATQQWSSRVRFRETIETLYSRGFRIFVEVGPSSNLTAFTNDILRGRDALAVASNNRRRPGLEQLQHLLGRLFASGVNVNLDIWYRNAETQVSATPPAATPLSLSMPAMHLSETLVQNLQDQLHPPQERPSEPVACSGQTAVVSAYFDLMQDFLKSQEQVFSQFSTHPAAVSCAYPFLGKILSQDESYLECDRLFSLDPDFFLAHHTLGGQPSQWQPDLLALPVIPFTFSMEIIAEAAHYLLGGQYTVVSLHNLRAYRWLTLDEGNLHLCIRAQRQEPTPEGESVWVRLFQQQTVGPETGLLVFEGEVRLSPQALSPPPPQPFGLNAPKRPRLADADLYQTGMFHGPLLQGVKHLRQWSEEGIEADLQVLPVEEFFSEARVPQFQLDPGLLDAAGQLVGYWLTEQFGPDFNCFPFQVNAFYQYAAPLPAGSLVDCRGTIRFTSPQQIAADFELLDARGQVIARLEQWQDRYFAMPTAFSECRLHPQTAYLSEAWMQAETGLTLRRIPAFGEHFLDEAWAIWQRVLVHLMLTPTERETWYRFPPGNRRKDWLLGRIAAKDVIRQWAAEDWGVALSPIDIEIGTTDLGKPFAEIPLLDTILPDLSIAHTQGEAIAILAADAESIGVDLERLDARRDWSLLQGAFSESEQMLLQSLSTAQQTTALLTFWCAKEAAAKAAGTGLMGAPRRWQAVSYSPTENQMEIEFEAYKFIVQWWQTATHLLAVCQSPVRS